MPNYLDRKYQWRDGARQKLSAQVVGDELERIRQGNGGALTPEVTVENARPTNSPLHEGFEWNDSIAAEEYRLVQAREIIRAVEIVPEEDKGAGVAPGIRAFVTLGPPASRSYFATYDVMADPAGRQEFLQRALRELRQWRQRYQQFAELAAIFEAMDRHAA